MKCDTKKEIKFNIKNNIMKKILDFCEYLASGISSDFMVVLLVITITFLLFSYLLYKAFKANEYFLQFCLGGFMLWLFVSCLNGVWEKYYDFSKKYDKVALKCDTKVQSDTEYPSQYRVTPPDTIWVIYSDGSRKAAMVFKDGEYVDVDGGNTSHEIVTYEIGYSRIEKCE